MSRRRANHLEYAHHELLSWASWLATHQGENGVMGAQVSNYDGISTDTPPHALIPRVDMPRQVSWVDIAYMDAPKTHKIAIKTKYKEGGRISRHAEDRLLEYVSGALLLLKRLST